MRTIHGALAAFTLCVALGAWCAEGGQKVDAGIKPGLTVGKDGVLLKDGVPYHGIGINYFSAFNRRLQDPKDSSYREGFRKLAEKGIPFVRFSACGFYPIDYKLYMEDKEAYFKLMDDVVKAAEETKIGLIPSLFWYTAAVPDLVGEPRNQWGNPQSKTIAFMRKYTGEIVARYLNSPAIWAWEFANEFSLDADLPNAADHRPWILPDRGTPTTRGDADDLTHDMIVTGLREFGKAVRATDTWRAVTTGNSLPRAAAQHLRTEHSWTQDTREQLMANMLDVTPDPNNLISVHIYTMDAVGRFSQAYTPFEETLGLCMTAAGKGGKALFVGEFGAPDDEKSGGRDLGKRNSLALITALERAYVPLAALWNFDLPDQEDFINVTPTNHRSYLLDALGRANRRIQLRRAGLHMADLEGGKFLGRMLDNAANDGRSGSGFNPLYHASFPGRNLYRGECVGLNFEHIFTGRAADRDRAMMTPRKDPCTLVARAASSALLQWPAQGSAWGMECEQKYSLAEDNCIDIEFKVTPRQELAAGTPYVALMWASYMNHTRDRKIHFYGTNGKGESWLTFGDDTPEGFETGTVAYHGVPNLPFEEGAQTLNIIEHPSKKFLLPFYYGLIDGDGDPATKDDTLAYIMMFDQREPIRFAMWNFIKDAADKPDPHSPAWDWQFVIHNPEIGKTYGYKARVIVKPFVSEDDVKQEYLRWAKKP